MAMLLPTPFNIQNSANNNVYVELDYFQNFLGHFKGKNFAFGIMQYLFFNMDYLKIYMQKKCTCELTL